MPEGSEFLKRVSSIVAILSIPPPCEASPHAVWVVGVLQEHNCVCLCHVTLRMDNFQCMAVPEARRRVKGRRVRRKGKRSRKRGLRLGGLSLQAQYRELKLLSPLTSMRSVSMSGVPERFASFVDGVRTASENPSSEDVRVVILINAGRTDHTSDKALAAG